MRVTVQYATQANDLPTEADFSAWVLAVGTLTQQTGELTIRIVDADESRQLNKTYRNKNDATNVLSFPLQTPPEVTTNYLGDIAICSSVVVREAVEQNKSTSAHWAHMVIHGVLHLLGYDHQTDEQANIMEALERRILLQLHFPDPYQNT